MCIEDRISDVVIIGLLIEPWVVNTFLSVSWKQMVLGRVVVGIESTNLRPKTRYFHKRNRCLWLAFHGSCRTYRNFNDPTYKSRMLSCTSAVASSTVLTLERVCVNRFTILCLRISIVVAFYNEAVTSEGVVMGAICFLWRQNRRSVIFRQKSTCQKQVKEIGP